MLPNESFLQVLHFADYKTLVLAQLAGRRVLGLAIIFAQELARRRFFIVTFRTTDVTYVDITTLTGGGIDYEPGNQPTLTAACRELARVIGPHAVSNLTFDGNTWNMPDVGVIFEAAPALKYAEDVVLQSLHESHMDADSEALMSNFAAMESLSLWLDNDVFGQFSWAFLRQESARELRHIKVTCRPAVPTDNVNGSVECLVRESAALPRPLEGDALELDFSDTYFSVKFCLRVIEVSI
ncbi:hypothetical protein AAVH_30215 [Aphelenchoides avenae]|nr:hypothetical protein AAVH_30215 [Aphelenchus avenae]